MPALICSTIPFYQIEKGNQRTPASARAALRPLIFWSFGCGLPVFIPGLRVPISAAAVTGSWRVTIIVSNENELNLG